MLKLKTAALASVLSLGLVPTADALSISYEVRIDFTLNNNDSLQVAILEWDGGSQTKLSTPYTVYPTGTQTIAHEAAFAPVKTLIVGIDEAVPGDATTQDHIVFFLNPEFFDIAIGLPFFRDALPGIRYPTFRAHVDGAVSGDAAEQAWLLDWAFGVSGGNEAGDFGGTGLTAQGVGVAFNSYGSSLPIEYSPTQVPLVPEPTSMLLLGTGLLAAGARRLRNRRRS